MHRTAIPLARTGLLTAGQFGLDGSPFDGLMETHEIRPRGEMGLTYPTFEYSGRAYHHSCQGSPCFGRRYGRTMAEVVVIVGLLSFFLMWILIALPRGRETSRMVGCQQNLMQIGKGLELYHQANRRFPTVPLLGPTTGDSPIRAMLDGLVLPDFVEIRDLANPPKPSIAPPKGARVPGLACPSDLNANSRRFEAPTSSYRANAGDTVDGRGGPFEPGRTVKASEVEAADGLAYTASFAERLVGDGKGGQVAPWNYAKTPGAVGPGGCPTLGADRWRGDAGSDWAEAGWRSTLYGHALVPNGSPSCIAEDGKTAALGASSAHPHRVNVLMLDGSLRGVTPTIDPKVWRAMGTVGDPKP